MAADGCGWLRMAADGCGVRERERVRE